MKATVNVEFGSEELEKFVLDVGVRLLKRLLESVGPGDTQNMLSMFQHGIEVALQAGLHPNHRGPSPGFGGPLPRVGPFGPQGRAGDPNNVQPIRETGHVDRCFAIEATRSNEGGVGCCSCATFNGVQRVHCRNCGHKLCVIATPPPAEGFSPVGDGG